MSKEKRITLSSQKTAYICHTIKVCTSYDNSDEGYFILATEGSYYKRAHSCKKLIPDSDNRTEF